MTGMNLYVKISRNGSPLFAVAADTADKIQQMLAVMGDVQGIPVQVICAALRLIHSQRIELVFNAETSFVDRYYTASCN